MKKFIVYSVVVSETSLWLKLFIPVTNNYLEKLHSTYIYWFSTVQVHDLMKYSYTVQFAESEYCIACTSRWTLFNLEHTNGVIFDTFV